MERGEKAQSHTRQKRGQGRALAVLLFIVVAVFAIAGGLVYGLNRAQQSTSISTFENNFDAAPRVALLVTAYNGLALAATVGCATNLIEQLAATHGSAHRDTSTIDFYVINQSACVYSPYGLGSSYINYSKASPSQCLSMSANEPRIFINFSSANQTMITPTALYVMGDVDYLTQCGVAAELTST